MAGSKKRIWLQSSRSEYNGWALYGKFKEDFFGGPDKFLSELGPCAMVAGTFFLYKTLSKNVVYFLKFFLNWIDAA